MKSNDESEVQEKRSKALSQRLKGVITNSTRISLKQSKPRNDNAHTHTQRKKSIIWKIPTHHLLVASHTQDNGEYAIR